MGSDKRERQKQGRQARLEAARAAQQRARRLRTLRNAAILIVAGVLLFWLYVQVTDDDGDTVATDSTALNTSTTGVGSTTTAVPPPFTYGTGACPADDGSSPQTLTFTDAPQQCIDPTQTYTAVFDTTEGTIRVALDTTTTPGTTNNFVTLSRYHFYDGTAIFRTDPSIGIIQGGAPSNSASDPGPGYDLPDEGFDFTAIGGQGGPYRYAAGDLVMARSSMPNGAGAQYFFCVTDDCANLDSQGVYVKFGTVSEGLDVLESMLALHQEDTTGAVLGGAPSRPVTVESVTIEATAAS